MNNKINSDNCCDNESVEKINDNAHSLGIVDPFIGFLHYILLGEFGNGKNKFDQFSEIKLNYLLNNQTIPYYGCRGMEHLLPKPQDVLQLILCDQQKQEQHFQLNRIIDNLIQFKSFNRTISFHCNWKCNCVLNFYLNSRTPSVDVAISQQYKSIQSILLDNQWMPLNELRSSSASAGNNTAANRKKYKSSNSVWRKWLKIVNPKLERVESEIESNFEKLNDRIDTLDLDDNKKTCLHYVFQAMKYISILLMLLLLGAGFILHFSSDFQKANWYLQCFFRSTPSSVYDDPLHCANWTGLHGDGDSRQMTNISYSKTDINLNQKLRNIFLTVNDRVIKIYQDLNIKDNPLLTPSSMIAYLLAIVYGHALTSETSNVRATRSEYAKEFTSEDKRRDLLRVIENLKVPPFIEDILAHLMPTSDFF